MRRPAVLLVSVLALVVGMVTGTAVASAAVPTAPYTAVGLAVGGGTGAATPNGARTYVGDEITSSHAFPSSVFVEGGTGDRAYIDLNALAGAPFAAGQALQVGSSIGPVQVRSGARACTAESGNVTIREAAGEGTAFTAFAADIDVACNGMQFVGFVRVTSTVGFAGVDLTPGLVTFPTVTLGNYTNIPVTLTASGTEALPYISSMTFGGEDPDDFSVVGDDCKDQELAAGASCTVTVRARPLVGATRTATLVIVHDDSTPYEVRLLAAAQDVADGTYRPVTPTRVLDTRTGQGGRRGPLPTGGVLRLNLSPYLSGSASAVVLNLTVDKPQKPGYLTAYPSGTARPTASSMNFPAGWQGANLVTVPLGTGNQIDIYNYLGNTSVLADMVGYYATGNASRGSGGGYHPTLVERLLDTRTWGYGKLPAGYSVSIPVRYSSDQGNVAALAVTVTAVRPSGTGYLTTWNNSSSIPRTSTLNFSKASGVISNSAIVPAAYNGRCSDCAYIAVLNMSSVPIDLVVDINGYFDRGGLPAYYRYEPLRSPTRIVDSRSGLGTTPLGPNTTRTITAPTSVAGYDTVALDANITAVTPTVGTYVTVWPTYDDYPRPLASILNPNARQTIANHAIAEVGYGNKFNLYNAAGTNNLLVDVSGTFELFPHTPADQIPHTGGDPGSGKVAGPVVTAGRNVAGVQPAVRAG